MKEIIIDGVNVAGCNFFIEDYQRANNIEGRYEHCKNVCELNGDNYFYCEMNKNCYYKQLKRLEQENAELKYEIDRQKDTIFYLNNLDVLHKTLLQYKTALEEIRGIAKREYDKFIIEKDFCESDGCIWVIIRKINEVLGAEE